MGTWAAVVSVVLVAIACAEFLLMIGARSAVHFMVGGFIGEALVLVGFAAWRAGRQRSAPSSE